MMDTPQVPRNFESQVGLPTTGTLAKLSKAMNLALPRTETSLPGLFRGPKFKFRASDAAFGPNAATAALVSHVFREVSPAR